ncbi:MAG: SDR family NAD(P)-dependent oxidoreductase, partial [Actinobacteria bacterium]|nr:SDR family NAD(P)-dependent oxidoreductase [Actinomycetota bacterium]
MDLGISGKWAIVSGSTRGLGLACAEALAAEGVNIVLNARTDIEGEQVAVDLRARFGVEVIFVVADVATAGGREQLHSAHPNVDILVTNASGPSPS